MSPQILQTQPFTEMLMHLQMTQLISDFLDVKPNQTGYNWRKWVTFSYVWMKI